MVFVPLVLELSDRGLEISCRQRSLSYHAKCTPPHPASIQNCDMLHTLALPPFLGFGECAVPLSPSSDQLNPLVLVVAGLRTEDTVPQPETVHR
jgi:hypothetical protein